MAQASRTTVGGLPVVFDEQSGAAVRHLLLGVSGGRAADTTCQVMKNKYVVGVDPFFIRERLG